MIIRPTTVDDLEKIDRIWKEYIETGDRFGIPDTSNLVTHAVVESAKGRLIAFGMVKLFAEAILILDKNESRRNKINAIQALMLEAIRGSRQHNLSQLHCFIQREEFSRIMKKHYNFKNCKGEALVMEL